MASVAYGPEAIVLVLAAAGGHGLGFTLPVTSAIAGLPAVLVASYRQVIAAFPDGGVPSERRTLGRPISAYVRGLRASEPATRVTVLVPEAEPEHLWQRLLQNQRARSSPTPYDGTRTPWSAD